MKTAYRILIVVTAALLMLFPLPVLAAPGGGGPGGGGPGGGGPGGGGGGNETGDAAGALYGDLYVIERDGQGVPITRPITYVDAETGLDVTVDCLQPIASPVLGECMLLPLNGEKPDFDPELEDACGVQAAYVDYIQEVSFGRESVARAPSGVIDKSYAEALKAMNFAAGGMCVCDMTCTGMDPRAIRQDAAGRLTLCLLQEDTGAYAWKTIDAPLENLGLYGEMMTNGCFGIMTEEMVGEEGVPVVVTMALDPSGIFYLGDAGLGYLVCEYGAAKPTSAEQAAEQEQSCTVTPDVVGGTPDTPCWWESPITPAPVTSDDLLASAVFIAAGADKTSPIAIDEIINLNNYLSINIWTYTRVKKNQVLTIEYFPFTAADGPGGWFGYTRGIDAARPGTIANLLVVDTTGTLFTPSDVDVFGMSPPGVDLESVAIMVCRSGFPLMNGGGAKVVCNNAWMNPVYSETNTNGCGGANWFAQAAEDARKTIWYLHNWRVPEIGY